MLNISEKYKSLVGKSKSNLIFVIGSGRSGTHWIGNILSVHPEIRSTVEAWPMFKWVKDMALYPETRKNLIPRLVLAYKIQNAISSPRHYLDKSHPNIWIADKLAENLPNSLFIGIKRNPYATVASMLKHEGVLRWIERWEEFPVPNEFLGITEENKDKYGSMPLAAKCALRICSHYAQMESLENKIGERLKVFDYDELICDIGKNLSVLENFLKLKDSIPTPHIKIKSQYKWKNELSAKQIDQIAKVVGYGPEHV